MKNLKKRLDLEIHLRGLANEKNSFSATGYKNELVKLALTRLGYESKNVKVAKQVLQGKTEDEIFTLLGM